MTTSLLLGDPSPSLRWRTAVELEGASHDDDEVLAWRAEVDTSPDIAALLDCLGSLRGRPQAAAYALCQLAYLGYTGPEVEGAVEHIFAHQQPDGSWSWWSDDQPKPAKRRRASAPPTLPHSESYRFVTNLTVVPLRGIAAAGFATDPRAERGYDWLIEQRLFDGSWTGSHKADLGLDGRSSGEDPDYRKLNPGEGCRSATTGAVACLALHPQRRRSDAARTGVDHLLSQPIRRDANLGYEVSRLVGLEPASGGFTFYVTHDHAFLLDLASRCGVSSAHRRVNALVDDLEHARGQYGLWEHPVHPQLSRWLSFDIESSRRRLADGDWIGNEDPVDATPAQRQRQRH